MANILIGPITLWAIYIVIAWLFDLSIMFPNAQVEPDEIPMGRLHAIRLAVIVTFAFYGVMQLLQGSAEVFPIHFLKAFLFFLSITVFAVAWKAQTGGTDASLKHWALAFFWLAVGLVFHFASPPRFRSYFRRK